MSFGVNYRCITVPDEQEMDFNSGCGGRKMYFEILLVS
jgi:hypothetical protein